jgi:hypothetical protein
MLAGAIAGRLRGGRLARLGDLKFRAPAVIFAILAAQVVLGHAPRQARGLAVVLTYAGVGLWIVVNLGQRTLGLRLGFTLIGIGWAMNFAVMAPNGAMPVSEDALSAVGAPAAMNVQDGHLYKHERRESTNASSWLGDEIPVAPLRAVISVGDIVLALGILLLISSAMVSAGSGRGSCREYEPRGRVSSSMRRPAPLLL